MEALLRSKVIGKSKKSSRKARSESRPENVLNLPIEDGEKERSVAALTNQAGDSTTLRSVRKSLEKLAKLDPISAPLPKRIEERQIRKAAYANTVDDLKKWDDLVFANRIAPTLEFSSPGAALQRPQTLEDLVESFEPESRMERELAKILESTGTQSEESIVRLEDEQALKSMSLEDLKKKRAQLAKLRSLLFHHEIKARHAKKIKSKEYHRRLQKGIRKKAKKFGGLDNEEATKKMLEDMAFHRIKERLTQKHSTMNRFARRIMRRGWGVADEQTREALEEQLRQKQELKQNVQSAERTSDDSESSDSDEEGKQDYKKTRKALMQILNGEADVDEIPKKGLIGLPFMQKALKKQKKQTENEAKEILQKLDGVREMEEEPVGSARLQFEGKNLLGTNVSDSELSDSKRLDRNLAKAGCATASKEPQTSILLTKSSENRSKAEEAHAKIPIPRHPHDFLFRKPDDKEVIENETTSDPHIPSRKEHSQPAIQIETPCEIDVEYEASKKADSKEKVSGEGAVRSEIPSQETLIQMAFEDDDVHEEFQKEKEEEMARELPKLEDISLLPGWGRWKDEQQEPKWMQKKRSENEKIRERALRKRKDAKKPFVFISEKPNEKMDCYKAQTVPFPFASEEEYKASKRHPIGPDFNTSTAFEDFIRPKVMRRHGTIIEPLKLNRSLKDIREHVQDLKQGKVKVRKIVGGTVHGQQLIPDGDS